MGVLLGCEGAELQSQSFSGRNSFLFSEWSIPPWYPRGTGLRVTLVQVEMYVSEKESFVPMFQSSTPGVHVCDIGASGNVVQ